MPCSYTFSECVSRPCLLQSPNYPGLYPRNTTCAYRIHVRRTDTPKNMHPLVMLGQHRSNKIAVQESVINELFIKIKSSFFYQS